VNNKSANLNERNKERKKKEKDNSRRLQVANSRRVQELYQYCNEMAGSMYARGLQLLGKHKMELLDFMVNAADWWYLSSKLHIP
jgi:hypothetical protein